MTDRDPVRMRELELRDSELSDLFDAAARDVAPPDVLARSRRRLSATLGVSVGALGGVDSAVVDSAASLASAKSAAASAAHGAAAVTAAKSSVGLAPLVAAAGKPVLLFALASTVSVALWSAQPKSAQPAAPDAKPRSAEQVDATLPALPKPHHVFSDHAHSDAPSALDATPAPDAMRRTLESPTAAPPARPATPVARPRTAPTRPEAPPSTAGDELRSLQAAQAALATQPADAVLALRAHTTRWPHSWLDEERDALLVEALLRAGDRPSAARALAALEEQSPRSPALPRLHSLFE